MTKKIAWEPHRDNISKVEYKLHQGSLINGQNVTRDVLGRVISLDLARAGYNTRTHSYGYNTRGELTADTVSTGDSQAYTWAYDPIGNRKQAWTSRDYVSKTYHTSNLNQYTEITDNTRPSFTPVHDHEGNQTLVRTNTGDWQVTYNADNRPVTFTKGNLRIENKYDYRGRRLEKATYSNNQLQKRLLFLYNGYLQIAAVDATNTSTPVLLHTLYWDPTEPAATRPLVMVRPEDNAQNWYEYTHTLNKNVSHLIDKTGSIVAHYDYDAYGNMIEQTGSLANRNPIRFSSEYDDEELGLIYYNYRHYNPRDGRWINRDPITESGGNNLYGFIYNKSIINFDYIGLILKSKSIHLKENGFKRIDIEYPYDDSIEPGKGKANLHIHYKDDEYYWNNDIKNKDKCFNFINKKGQKLPKEARTYLTKNRKLWKTITENAEKFINQKGGFSPQYGGGLFSSGIFALALLPIELDNINESVKSLIENSKNGNFGEASEAKAKLINSLPPSSGVPTGFRSLMIEELEDIEAAIHSLYNNQE